MATRGNFCFTFYRFGCSSRSCCLHHPMQHCVITLYTVLYKIDLCTYGYCLHTRPRDIAYCALQIKQLYRKVLFTPGLHKRRRPAWLRPRLYLDSHQMTLKIEKMFAKRKFVIDTDGGVDDAQAILMALACPDVHVVAITTTHGNTDINNVCKNILRLLRVADRLDIPVYKGASKSMLGTNAEQSPYHGTDGFGDVTDDDVIPDRTRVEDTHAVDQLIELANQNPGEITLVCLGPLTNIALATRLQPEFGSKLKKCVCMGGNYEGQGNITASAEFNFHSDPEAAYIVLNQLGSSITLVCWELCLKYVFSWESYEEIRKSTTVKATFLKAIERKAVEYSRAENWDSYIMCDELATTVALETSVVKEQDVVYATVETRGITRGQMVVDWGDKLNKPKNVAIVKTIDKSLYRKCVERAMK